VQTERPAVEYLPAAHGEAMVAALATPAPFNTSDAYEPAGTVAHAEPRAAAPLYVPAAQFVQTVAAARLYLPAGHAACVVPPRDE